MTKQISTEAEEQITVIEYCDLKGIPIYHIANEGKPTKDQISWLKRLKEQGYATAICYGAGEAIAIIEKYLKQGE